MGLFSFFRKPQAEPNIFIDSGEVKLLETKTGEVDYVLSRSLYASVPTQDNSYNDYSLGNYVTKTYIDTLASFISIPRVSGGEEKANININRFIDNNKSTLIKIYRQAMIDGLVYVWCRVEKNIFDKYQLKIKIIPRETLIENECIKAPNGFFKKIVFESTETWKEKKREKNNLSFTKENEEQVITKTSKIRITITEHLETVEIIGDKPPYYKDKKYSSNSFFRFIPIFTFYNNQLSFLSAGLPEIANILPFIKKYNTIFKKVETHLYQVLDPKLKLHLKSAKSFLKNNFGVKENDFEKIESGELKPDVTQFKAAILTTEGEDITFVSQNDNIKSALDVLNLIHWIIVEMTMPEYLYGTALNTTNASVKEQSPVWVKKIEDRRTEYTQFYIWLINVFLECSYLFHDKIIENTEDFIVEWEELEAKDDVALMQALHNATTSILKVLDAGLIAPETALNALKAFITVPESYEQEHKKAIEYIKEKANMEADTTADNLEINNFK